MKKIILVLGSPNDENGNLSQIAINRLECAFSLYQNNDDAKFLLTGGFGEHFNITLDPHASYAQKFLIEKGVDKDDFLEFALSSNTFDDFEKSKLIINKEAFDLLMVVTSDFHMERVRIIYNKIIKYPDVLFIPAVSTFSQYELDKLLEHEKNAINRLLS